VNKVSRFLLFVAGLLLDRLKMMDWKIYRSKSILDLWCTTVLEMLESACHEYVEVVLY
jgi:hypothetical protein